MWSRVHIAVVLQRGFDSRLNALDNVAIMAIGQMLMSKMSWSEAVIGGQGRDKPYLKAIKLVRNISGER